MRVALIRKRFDPFGGGERYLANLISRLKEKGVEVHIVAARWPHGAEESGVRVRRVTCPNKPPFLSAYVFARRVGKLLSRERFDLVHSFERTYGQDIYRAGDGVHSRFLDAYSRFVPGPSAALKARLPLSIVYNRLERRLYSHPDLKLVIANSERGKAEIVETFGLPEDRVVVIYNGVEAARFEPDPEVRALVRKRLGIDEREPVFLFAGSGFRRKGLGFAVNALKNVGEGVLLAAGKGKRARYIRLAEMLGLGRRVRVMGPVSEVEQLFKAADAFVLPSVYEPFSNACLEAMAAGLPVVTTVQNGASEVIEPGVNGFVTQDPRDAAALGGLMDEALSLDRAKLGEHNSRVLAGLTWEEHVRRVISAYSQVLGRDIGI